jgi:hypothetical protein
MSNNPGKRLIAALVLAFLTVLAFGIPDIKRYLKMRSM